MTACTAWLVGETIDPSLQVDNAGFQCGVARVRLTLPLNAPVRLERRIRVSLIDVILVKFR